MSHENRCSVLLTAIRNLRRARRAIRRGAPVDALTHLGIARHDYGLYVGMAVTSGPWPMAGSPERVRACVQAVERELEREVWRLHQVANRPKADVGSLVADIAAGVYVLATRDGVQITREQAAERGRCIAMAVIGNHDVRELPTGSENVHRVQVPVLNGGATRDRAALVTGGAR